MRRALAVLSILAVVLAPLAAVANPILFSTGTTGVSVAQTNASTAFVHSAALGGGGASLALRWVLVRSRSTSTHACFFRLTTGATTTATTGATRLEPGASMRVPYAGNGGWLSMGSICATGQTATFDVDGGL